MRDPTRTIEFDFEFQFPRAGQQDMANAITVCEPNFDKRLVHRRMSSMVIDALVNAQRKAAKDAPVSATPDPVTGVSTAEEPKEITAEELMTLLRLGMSTEEFVRFTEFVQKELTDCKSLAFVGSDPSIPVKDRDPVSDLVWMNLSREGGLEAIDQVIAEFARFFLGLRRSQKSNGTERSSSSEAKPVVSSRTRKQ